MDHHGHVLAEHPPSSTKSTIITAKVVLGCHPPVSALPHPWDAAAADCAEDAELAKQMKIFQTGETIRGKGDEMFLISPSFC